MFTYLGSLLGVSSTEGSSVSVRADWRDMNHDDSHLQSGEPIDVYGSRVDAVDELVDRGGGYLHDESGDVVAFVAPLPR